MRGESEKKVPNEKSHALFLFTPSGKWLGGFIFAPVAPIFGTGAHNYSTPVW